MTTPDLLPTVEIEASGPADRTVIWLHGLGADGHDFEPIVPILGLPPHPATRFVFPHAPAIPVTLNGGMVMPAWYDIRELDLQKEHDEAGVRASAARVETLIAREKARGVPSERIVLAGFSQGGAVALHTALRHPERLAGLLLLSSYLVLPDRLASEAAPANRDLPVFQGHGTLDPMVPLARGEHARDALRAAGWTVDWRTYPMQHEVCIEEIRDAGAWLADVLAGREPTPDE